MFQLDEQFLNDIGLVNLPDDQKKALLQHIYDELELRVGERLAVDMTDEQMSEFEAILDRDEQRITTWLQQYLPDYTQQEEYKRFLQAAHVVEGQTPSMDMLGDYVATKWLEKNRPNYREVVAAVLEELRQEIITNRNTLLDQA